MLALAIAILATVLLTPFSHAQSDDSYTVLASVVFLRTGERTPQILGDVPSTLTSLGAQQAYAAGSFLRERYFSSAGSGSGIDKAPMRGLSANSIDPRQFYALALDTQPTIGSAQAFAQGFYPPYTLNENTAALLDPTSVLANGTYVANPLDGYQYPQIRTAGELDPEFVYVAASLECPAFQQSSIDYTDSPEFEAAQLSSKPLYESVGSAALSGVLSEGQQDYLNAYAIYDYLGYHAVHNSSIAAAVNGSSSQGSDTTDLDKLRFLADAQQFALLGNLTAINNISTPTTGLPGNTEGSISTIAGNMLLAKILLQMQLAIQTSGRYFKLSLLAGDFQPLISLFALTRLSDLNSKKFRSIPDFASMAVFELFTHSSSSAFPDSTDDLWVHFYFRNGTGPQDDQQPFQSYPLFGHGPSETDMRWRDFRSEASTIAMGNVGEWCQACSSSSIFCPAFNSSLLGGSDDSSSGAFASSRSRNSLTPAVAGVVGAIVALFVAGLIFALAMLVGGLRLRKKRNPSEGGFQGGAKMAPDRDVEVSGLGAAGKSGAVVAGREAPAQEEVGGTVPGGHERVGSWEMKKNAAGMGMGNRSRASFESDGDDDFRRAVDPFADPVKAHERV